MSKHANMPAKSYLSVGPTLMFLLVLFLQLVAKRGEYCNIEQKEAL